jgi:hypothetical protein
MRKQIYNRSIQPLSDIVSTFYNGLIGRRAKYPQQKRDMTGRATSQIYMTPCDTTREHAIKKLEYISKTSLSPIVKGLARYFNKGQMSSSDTNNLS